MSGVTLGAELVVQGGRPLRGRLRLPGCKGISHRGLLLAALADGRTRLENLADGEDVGRTAGALDRLGVRIGRDSRVATIAAHGVGGLREPETVIDCGNSGTTMRMLAGLVAGRPFLSVLTGDDSLSRRPMRRVVAPLRAMGATVDGRADGDLAPLTVRGGDLRGVRHELAVASGQVKTALVLAGLQAGGETEIVEPAPSRDHTERMLGALGAPIERVDDRTLRVRAGAPQPFELVVPGDPSSAAFFVVAATIVPGSSIVLEDVSLNPGRVEYLDLLRAMGARIEVDVLETRVGEPCGTIAVEAAPLHGIEISGHEAIVDELPVLAVAAAFADGVTTIRDAAEMAVKETNRIGALEQELTQLGIGVAARPDGLVIRGGAPKGATLKSHGDHRIALCGAVAGLAAEGETTVRGWPAVAISYPGFEADLAQLLDAP
ncbi:MAG TPA: 3-phosphoshikimate 1-carboxyvinyltransferase [Acidimicrobiia bacterium]